MKPEPLLHDRSNLPNLGIQFLLLLTSLAKSISPNDSIHCLWNVLWYFLSVNLSWMPFLWFWCSHPLLYQIKPFLVVSQLHPIILSTPLAVVIWHLMLQVIFKSQVTSHYHTVCSLRARIISVFLILYLQHLKYNRYLINIYWVSKGNKENISKLILQTFSGQILCFRLFCISFSTVLRALNKVRITLFFQCLKLIIGNSSKLHLRA